MQLPSTKCTYTAAISLSVCLKRLRNHSELDTAETVAELCVFLLLSVEGKQINRKRTPWLVQNYPTRRSLPLSANIAGTTLTLAHIVMISEVVVIYVFRRTILLLSLLNC